MHHSTTRHNNPALTKTQTLLFKQLDTRKNQTVWLKAQTQQLLNKTNNFKVFLNPQKFVQECRGKLKLSGLSYVGQTVMFSDG